SFHSGSWCGARQQAAMNGYGYSTLAESVGERVAGLAGGAVKASLCAGPAEARTGETTGQTAVMPAEAATRQTSGRVGCPDLTCSLATCAVPGQNPATWPIRPPQPRGEPPPR